MDIVYHAWSQYIDGSPSCVWEQKLKKTKIALKTWVKTLLNTPTSIRHEQVAELSAIQLGMEDRVITKSQLSLEQFAQSRASQSFRKEEENIRL